MTRMRYVKMDRIMNHMLIHALREVFRQEKEQFAGTTRLKHARRGTYNDLRPHEGALQERKEEMDKRRR